MKSPARLVLGAALLLTGASCTVLGPAKLTDAQEVIADMTVPPSALHITSTINRADRSYRPGERITLSLSVNHNADVAVLQVLPNGETTILFPNRYHAKAALAAGTTLTIPNPGEPYSITAATKGPQLFELIASTNDQSWLFTKAPEKGAAFVVLGSTTRGFVKDIIDSLRSRTGKSEAALQSLTVQIE